MAETTIKDEFLEKSKEMLKKRPLQHFLKSFGLYFPMSLIAACEFRIEQNFGPHIEQYSWWDAE